MIEELNKLTAMVVYPRSFVEQDGTAYFLAKGTHSKRLGVKGDTAGFTGEFKGDVLVCPLTAENAKAIRSRLPWLNPAPLGLATSAGCGDRLGMATPGHIHALRHFENITPIFSQQSIRENARTGRSPQQVMDEAMWGVFQEGWNTPWGADADHLKTAADIDTCVAAGFTFFTIDPGDHVDNDAHTDSMETLRLKFGKLDWKALGDFPSAMERRYRGQSIQVEDYTLTFDEEALLRAACKYSGAIAHTAAMYKHLQDVKGDAGFDLEVSVDETETPTTPLEHIFIVRELRRLGVEWVSLAPRYVGRFEKGVDYIGDLDVFEAEFAKHAAIAREMGPYKLSIHSGSDKFSIYPIMARLTRGVAHLKTAGTSYLEALRAIARVDPTLFRDVLTLAIARYPEDRASYHVSADENKVPTPDSLEDAELPLVPDQFDTREALHVTFGSALDAFEARIKSVLDAHEDEHYAALEAHFIKHLEPFAKFA